MAAQQKSVFNTVLVLGVFVISLMFFTIFWHSNSSAAPENLTKFAEPRSIPNFNLITDKDVPFTQDNLKNHWTLLFFGFTHCKDVCPATMAVVSRIYPMLMLHYPNLQVAFVTVDPDRDTQAVVGRFVKNFQNDFIGLTGTPENLQSMQKNLGVSVQGLSHSASIYLFNPRGKWVAMFPLGMRPDELQTAFEKSTVIDI